MKSNNDSIIMTFSILSTLLELSIYIWIIFNGHPWVVLAAVISIILQANVKAIKTDHDSNT